MGTREEELVDSMVEKTLDEMIKGWSEVERTPYNVYMFAANKLDFPVTQEEVEAALQRRLSRAFHALGFGEYIADYGDEVLQALRDVMTEQQMGQQVQDESDFQQVPWEQYGYAALEAVHKVLYEYGAPDLLYEVPKE